MSRSSKVGGIRDRLAGRGHEFVGRGFQLESRIEPPEDSPIFFRQLHKDVNQLAFRAFRQRLASLFQASGLRSLSAFFEVAFGMIQSRHLRRVSR